MASYQRILLKLSGESLMGKAQSGIDTEVLQSYTWQIAEVRNLGVGIGLVVGGGNIFRGLSGSKQGFDRINGDYMGMLATVINSLALQSAFMQMNIPCRLFTAIRMEPIGELWNRLRAIEAISNGEICVFAAGTGNPFFTTDTTAALRGIEIGADILLKGTRVDGVYSDDPEKNPAAERFENISFDEVIHRKLKVMDQTAFTMCRENNLPIRVFDMNQQGNLMKLISGEKVGTIIRN